MEGFIIWLIVYVIGIGFMIPLGIRAFHKRGIWEKAVSFLKDDDDYDGMKSKVIDRVLVWSVIWVLIGFMTLITGSYLDTFGNLVILLMAVLGLLDAGPFGAAGGFLLGLICDGFINYTGSYIPVAILDVIEKSPLIIYHMLFQ